MVFDHLSQWWKLARKLPGFLNTPVTPHQALHGIRRRLEQRDELFLYLVNTSIYNNPSSPYRDLLLRAGCEAGDLKKSVQSSGLESTLKNLWNEGVYLSLEEFKALEPIRRNGLCLEIRESDFDNPAVAGGGISGRSSATRSKGTRANYTWPFIEEEAENECVLYGEHGVLDSSLALWYPVHLSIAGIHNMLMNLKCHRPPEKWFSHTTGRSPRDRLMVSYLSWCSWRQGMRLSLPETVELSDSWKVASWMEDTGKREGGAVLKTFTSSAVRAVQEATKRGMDLNGCTIFVGGEALTQERYEFISSAGVDVISRYVATETGLVGASCRKRREPDEMHIYEDRLTVIEGPEQGKMLFTTVLPTAPKVLLNVDLGDEGFLTRSNCECFFGKLGMRTFVSKVRSRLKQTGEGMSVLLSELNRIVGGLIQRYGGSPIDYQFWKIVGDGDLERIAIVVSPTVGEIDDKNLIEEVLDNLRAWNPRCRLASDVWRQSSMFELVRDYPVVTEGQKQLLLISNPRRSIRKRS